MAAVKHDSVVRFANQLALAIRVPAKENHPGFYVASGPGHGRNGQCASAAIFANPDPQF